MTMPIISQQYAPAQPYRKACLRTSKHAHAAGKRARKTDGLELGLRARLSSLARVLFPQTNTERLNAQGMNQREIMRLFTGN